MEVVKKIEAEGNPGGNPRSKITITASGVLP